MKGTGSLLILTIAAITAGVLLVVFKPDQLPRSSGQDEDEPSAEAYVEEILRLRFKSPPVLLPVPAGTWLARVDANLSAQFGPGGLARRSRALDLMGFREFSGQSLRQGLSALQSVGLRGWLDSAEGALLLADDFDETQTEDRVLLHGLLAQLLIEQISPMALGQLSDDEWIAESALRSAIAESITAKLRDEERESFLLPTALITERESLLAGLPIYLAALGELPQERGAARIFVETRLRTKSRTLPDLIKNPPRSTLELLGGDHSSIAPVTLPSLRPEHANQLEESLGALQVQTLIEWMESYEQAQALALLWRGDRYRLFANSSGDHLIWVCRWETAAAASRATEIFSKLDDSSNTPKRFISVSADGNTTIFTNCADSETQDSLGLTRQ
ncbi:MAG: hypothetical protein P8M65_03790 [Roseibacillus sp.]|nr:hypothetical protein [Roseibacillus sp.]